MEQTCQVLVVGAGPAGVLAALAAARAGADTVLVDEGSRPGGLGTTQYHRHLCGWFAGEAGEPGGILHGPLVCELADRLRRASPSARAVRRGRVWVWPLEPEQWGESLSAWIRETPSLRFLRCQRAMGFAPTASDRAGTIRTCGAAGEILFVPRIAVDASGIAVLAALAGWELDQTPERERQLAGCTLRLTGVESGDSLLPVKVPHALNHAWRGGLFPAEIRFTTFIPAGDRFALLRLNLPAAFPADRVSALADAAVEHLKNKLPAFARAMVESRSSLQARDGPRIRGRHRLTAEDIETARSFNDRVARGFWPMEMWTADRGPAYRYASPGAGYDIPLRCLLSPASDRVLFAGRGLSCDPQAHASVRVMGTCMATGEAAGREAAQRAS